MHKVFSPETVDAISGNVLFDGMVLQRTPLQVQFSFRSSCVPAEVITPEEAMLSECFSAIGSRCLNSGMHLPVLDVDRGAKNTVYKNTYKTLLGSRGGQYDPSSNLRDLLGDHGIDLEVFDTPLLDQYGFSGDTYSKGMQVSSVLLRSVRPVFEVVPSTAEGHAHVYVQEPFSTTDHGLLLDELRAVGVLSDSWAKMAKQEQMGVLRTPWTAKDPNHYPS